MTASHPHGKGHWLLQRMSAVLLLPLGLWFGYVLVTRVDFSRAAWLAFVAAPWHAGALIVFLLALLLHSELGVQVIIEDYVSRGRRERTLQALNQAVHLVAGVIGVFAVLHIAMRAVS
jgi:succinate dehydrogenase / fumarate reductase membrane anchor subunit